MSETGSKFDDAGQHDEARGSGPATRLRALPRVPLLAGGAALVVAVVVVVAAVVGGGGASGAEQAARRFVEGVLEGDCERVLTGLSAATNARLDDLGEQFTSVANPEGVDVRGRACTRLRDGAIDDARVTTVETLLEQDGRAIVHITSEPARGNVLRSVDVYVVKDGDDWKADLTLNAVPFDFLSSRLLGS